ncbi:MAG: hypothetical protein DCC75_11945 [Proteobacteria bacterium]|nr:MAG: hypothetical protein DCC75_11945 [Pseudomonadota bacterium]
MAATIKVSTGFFMSKRSWVFVLFFSFLSIQLSSTALAAPRISISAQTILEGAVRLFIKSRRAGGPAFKYVLERTKGRTRNRLFTQRARSNLNMRLIDLPGMGKVRYELRVLRGGRVLAVRNLYLELQGQSDFDSPSPDIYIPDAPSFQEPTGGTIQLVIPPGMIDCSLATQDETLQRVNWYRQQAGVQPLTIQWQLRTAATVHSIAMAAGNELTHEGWFEEIWELAGFHGSSMGQNIAKISATPSQAVDFLATSQNHLLNMQKASYRYLGVGCINDSRGQTWWTHNFGG